MKVVNIRKKDMGSQAAPFYAALEEIHIGTWNNSDHFYPKYFLCHEHPYTS